MGQLNRLALVAQDEDFEQDNNYALLFYPLTRIFVGIEGRLKSGMRTEYRGHGTI